MAKRVYNKAYLKACLSKGIRPKGMPYKDYSQFMKAEKAEAASEDDYNEMAEDGGDQGDEPDADDEKQAAAKKSEAADDGIDGDNLSKALDAYTATADALSVAGNSRESYLQARLDSGTITKSEKSELGQLWLGASDNGSAGTTLRKSVSDQLSEDPENEALINASEFVKSMVDTIDASLDTVTSEITRDGHATREFLKAQGGLIKALVQDQQQSHALIKALAERLQIVERAPAPRRSVGNHDKRDVQRRDLSKGGASVRDGDADQLTKAQVNQGIRSLMIKADERGDMGAKQQLAFASARFETDGVIKPNMEAAIRQEIGAL